MTTINGYSINQNVANTLKDIIKDKKITTDELNTLKNAIDSDSKVEKGERVLLKAIASGKAITAIDLDPALDGKSLNLNKMVENKQQIKQIFNDDAYKLNVKDEEEVFVKDLLAQSKSGTLTYQGISTLNYALNDSTQFDNKIIFSKLLSRKEGVDLLENLLTQKNYIFINDSGLTSSGKNLINTLLKSTARDESGISLMKTIAATGKVSAFDKEFINSSIDQEISNRFMESFAKIQKNNKYQSDAASKGQRNLGGPDTDCYDFAMDMVTAMGKGKKETNAPQIYSSKVANKARYNFDPKNPDKLDEKFMAKLKVGDMFQAGPGEHWGMYIGNGLIAHGNWDLESHITDKSSGVNYVVKDNSLVEREKKQRHGEPVITPINDMTCFPTKKYISIFRPNY